MNKRVKQAAQEAARGVPKPILMDNVPDIVLDSYRNDVASCAAHGVLMHFLELADSDPDFEKVRQKIIYMAIARSDGRLGRPRGSSTLHP